VSALPRGIEAQYQAIGYSRKEEPANEEAVAGQVFHQSHAVGGELNRSWKKK